MIYDSWMITDRHKKFDFRIRVEEDNDSRPDDADCYSPEDMAAWRRGQWRFATAVLTPVDRETGTVFESCTQALGSVEWGTLPGWSDEAEWGFLPEPPREVGRADWWDHPLRNMAVEAVTEALAEIEKLAADVADSKPSAPVAMTDGRTRARDYGPTGPTSLAGAVVRVIGEDRWGRVRCMRANEEDPGGMPTVELDVVGDNGVLTTTVLPRNRITAVSANPENRPPHGTLLPGQWPHVKPFTYWQD